MLIWLLLYFIGLYITYTYVAVKLYICNDRNLNKKTYLFTDNFCIDEQSIKRLARTYALFWPIYWVIEITIKIFFIISFIFNFKIIEKIAKKILNKQ